MQNIFKQTKGQQIAENMLKSPHRFLRILRSLRSKPGMSAASSVSAIAFDGHNALPWLWQPSEWTAQDLQTKG